MGTRRIRANWASLSLSDDDRAVVSLRRDGVPRCLRFASTGSLKQAIDEGTLSVRNWVLAVPKGLCILKSLNLPAHDLSEAATMVEFEITSLVPLPREDVTYGCTLLSRTENLLSILVWILRLEALEHYLEPYTAMGIRPVGVVPDAVAIHHWFMSATPDRPRVAMDVFVGRDRSLVLTDVEGNLQTAHEIVPPREDSGSSLGDAALEILRLRGEYLPASEDGGGIFLAGEDDCVAGIQEQLRSVAGGQLSGVELSVVPSPPMVSYSPESDSGQDGGGLRFEATVTTGLLAFFADSARRYLNLLSHEYLRHRQKRAAMLHRLQLGVMAGLLLLLLWACLAAAQWRLVKRSELIQLEIAPIKDIASAVDSKRQRVRAIQRQLANRDLIGRVVQELYEYTPQQISLCELRLSRNQGTLTVDLKGQADMLPTAFEYTEAVDGAKLLRGMQIVNAQQIPRAGGGSVVEFRANCVIRGN